VTMAMPPLLNGKSFLFVPSMGDDKRVKWTCKSGDIQPKYLPMQCRQ
jgi:Pilin (bacterial filament)